MTDILDIIEDVKDFQESANKTGLGRKIRDRETTPEYKIALTKLRKAISKISDDNLKSYLQEAVKCYDNNCLRAAVVLIWIAVMETLYTAVQKKRWVKKFDKKFKVLHGTTKYYRAIKLINDLLYVKDSIVIDILEKIGLYNRTVRAELEKYLKIRNNCGHPTKYDPGDQETSVYIEYLVDNVILKY